MPDEDIQPEGQGTNPTEEEVTTADDSENEEVTVDSEQEDTVDASEQLEELQKQNAQLKNYVKKLKGKKEETRTDLETPDVPVSDNAIQKQVLKANGMDESLIEVLEFISKEKGVDLLTAQSDGYFKHKQEAFEVEKREKEAQLGASKGSGAGKPKKTVSTPGLTKEEHKRMWKKDVAKFK